MQIKRRGGTVSQSEVLEDQEFAAQIDNQHGYDHPSQRSPLNRSIYSSGEFTLLVTGDVAHTASAFPRVPPPCRYRWCNASSAAFLTFSFTQCDFQPFKQFALLRISGRARIVCDVRPGGQQDKSHHRPH